MATKKMITLTALSAGVSAVTGAIVSYLVNSSEELELPPPPKDLPPPPVPELPKTPTTDVKVEASAISISQGGRAQKISSLNSGYSDYLSKNPGQSHQSKRNYFLYEIFNRVSSLPYDSANYANSVKEHREWSEMYSNVDAVIAEAEKITKAEK